MSWGNYRRLSTIIMTNGSIPWVLRELNRGGGAQKRGNAADGRDWTSMVEKITRTVFGDCPGNARPIYNVDERRYDKICLWKKSQFICGF